MPDHISIWRFRIRPSESDQFEFHYGPHGSWSTLFRRSDSYLGTTLLHSRSDPEVYLTIDRWRSIADLQQFRSQYAGEYEALDRQCERFTVEETNLGSFDVVDQ